MALTSLTYASCNLFTTGPRLPSPICRPSTSRTGNTPANVPVTKHSSAEYTAVSVKSSSYTSKPIPRAIRITLSRVMPCSMYFRLLVSTTPSTTMKK